MKVMHVLMSNKFSGAENVVCQIMSMFKNERDVQMAYCSPDGPIRKAIEERGFTFIPLKAFNGKELKKAIKAYAPDVIHAHDMRASFFVAKTKGKIPYISHIHNNAFDSRGLSLKSLAYLYAGKKAKHIFWVSESSFKGYAFHKKLEGKSSVLYNVVDVDALYKKAELDENTYDYDIAYIGRLTHPKNPQRLMQVLRLVKERIPTVKIAVVGSGDLEEEVKTLASEYNLLENVRFLGFMDNPLKILRDSKVMVMTSRWEGTPMCALEAMAFGVPIVSTPVDGLKDLVKNGENGYLYATDNYLAKSLADIVEDEELREKLSTAQREKSLQVNNVETYKEKIRKAYKNEE